MILLTLFFRFFHKNGLESSFLGQIDRFKNLGYSKFNFKKTEKTVFKINEWLFQKIQKKEKSIFQISEKNTHFFGKRFSFYFL